MPILDRPLVLVHGLWNTPQLFKRLEDRLNQPQSFVLAPHLPHDCGRINIRKLAVELDSQITRTLGPDVLIDLLGFSMGGLISRVWLQEMGGYQRTRRFFSVGSPHYGTLTAQLVPANIFAGIAEMKVGSKLIKSLNNDLTNLQKLNCRSYFCKFDLMVFPGFRAVLPIGPSISLPVFTHKALIKKSVAIEKITSDLFDSCSKSTMFD
ncbi:MULTISPECIES: esterase/lipase family protein [Prochlorococcus]|uniref:Probable alpha/beta superfamily lipase n=1 Tax=Prochlorococcus marinus (strain SARG / CCMP1375 / SS120) TaxID=167539 RepID=Q7VBM3_PROMA|nr:MULTISPECIES: alpha/beta fold hydrolase [Prochlorococcus]AAQ00114.1 Probable alpha/beta superfamily lipase [Prochlorococcus marinus subsp. marinus str. CCMP1375]KGG13910.1 lipase [Prochlorococcus marinus str. LG]KGG19043.1 lipase [Prochlorococcus marinus str. SS2]KGG23417.1 lipase [Prochlorococcus marinus str. SS35]KGG32347.1 lipase [Prochlorococcus marinus str. SS51]